MQVLSFKISKQSLAVHPWETEVNERPCNSVKFSKKSCHRKVWLTLQFESESFLILFLSKKYFNVWKDRVQDEVRKNCVKLKIKMLMVSPMPKLSQAGKSFTSVWFSPKNYFFRILTGFSDIKPQVWSKQQIILHGLLIPFACQALLSKSLSIYQTRFLSI